MVFTRINQDALSLYWYSNPEVEATYDHRNNRFNMDDTVLSA